MQKSVQHREMDKPFYIFIINSYNATVFFPSAGFIGWNLWRCRQRKELPPVCSTGTGEIQLVVQLEFLLQTARTWIAAARIALDFWNILFRHNAVKDKKRNVSSVFSSFNPSPPHTDDPVRGKCSCKRWICICVTTSLDPQRLSKGEHLVWEPVRPWQVSTTTV